MPTRVLIVDDEPLARQRLRSLLAQLPEVEVVGEHGSAAAAAGAVATLHPDVVFLDIEMPEETGLDLARQLAAPGGPLVVFVTAHAQHAVEAFHFKALHYLLKPFDRAAVEEALRRAAEVNALRESARTARTMADLVGAALAPQVERLQLRGVGRVHYVPLADIEWIDAQGTKIQVHAVEGVVTANESIQELSDRLPAHRFARIHRSTIVNLARIKELEIGRHGDYVLISSSGKRHSVGRSYRGAVRSLVGR